MTKYTPGPEFIQRPPGFKNIPGAECTQGPPLTTCGLGAEFIQRPPGFKVDGTLGQSETKYTPGAEFIKQLPKFKYNPGAECIPGPSETKCGPGPPPGFTHALGVESNQGLCVLKNAPETAHTHGSSAFKSALGAENTQGLPGFNPAPGAEYSQGPADFERAPGSKHIRVKQKQMGVEAEKLQTGAMAKLPTISEVIISTMQDFYNRLG